MIYMTSILYQYTMTMHYNYVLYSLNKCAYLVNLLITGFYRVWHDYKLIIWKIDDDCTQISCNYKFNKLKLNLTGVKKCSSKKNIENNLLGLKVKSILWALARAPDLHANIHRLLTSFNNSIQHLIMVPWRLHISDELAARAIYLGPGKGPGSSFEHSWTRNIIYNYRTGDK